MDQIKELNNAFKEIAKSTQEKQHRQEDDTKSQSHPSSSR